MILESPLHRLFMKSEASGLETALKQLSLANQRVKEWANLRLDGLYSNILKSPGTILVLLIVITGIFAQQGMSFQQQIDDDVEIFLPDGAPSTELLLEVRTEWSTDLAVIYIQTPNAFNTADSTNITEETFLKEISWIEGDSTNINSDSRGRGIDYDKFDHGRKDGVLWIISPAQVIKEINSSDGRFNKALCANIVDQRVPLSIDCSQDQTGGDYSIPDQDRIDQIIEESEGGFDALFKDTNDMDPFCRQRRTMETTPTTWMVTASGTPAAIVGRHAPVTSRVTKEYGDFLGPARITSKTVIDDRPTEYHQHGDDRDWIDQGSGRHF